MRWDWMRFGHLSRDDLYDLLVLRGQVFVVEQRCPYLDPDGLDRQAWHLLGRDAAGQLQAALRVVDPGGKYAEPSIGRVVTAPAVRGQGAGRLLMEQALLHCAAVWPGHGIRISAQAQLQRFYGSLGFQPVGEPYLEDDILHVEMLLGSAAQG